MPQLTNGTFKYTKRIKPGDPNEYNAPFREATAEISWKAEDDEAVIDNYLNEVSHLTVEQVNRMLTVNPTQKAFVKKATEVSTSQDGMQESGIQNLLPTGPITPTTAYPTNPAAADMMAIEKQKRKPGRPPKSVNLQTEPEINMEPVKQEPDEIDIMAPTPVEVSSKDLLDAITRKNAERMARPEGSTLQDGRDGRSVQLIRDLIGKYVQLPQTARDIPAELRQKFLEELKCL